MAAYQFSRSDTPVLQGQRIVTVGGGNVAMDCARTAKRLGAESSIILYRRTRKEMPGRMEEIQHTEEEGIEFELLAAPIEVVGNDKKWLTGLKCVRMQLGEADASGRARPVPIPGPEFMISCEVVVAAIGTRANPLLVKEPPVLSQSHLNEGAYLTRHYKRARKKFLLRALKVYILMVTFRTYEPTSSFRLHLN